MKLGEPLQQMVTSKTHQQTRTLVQAAAAACEDKKGEDTRILELDPSDSGLSDFFLVTSATNDRQAVAIADEIEHRLKRDFGMMPNSVEGRRNGEWILLDYVDFVAHVFLAERRAFYDIERLRKSAKPFTVPEFDTELKNALAEKTRAVREKSPAKPGASTRSAKKSTRATVTKAAPRKAPGKPAAASKAKKPQPSPTKAKPAAKPTGAKKSAKKASSRK
jgi:ribosome-associated protein